MGNLSVGELVILLGIALLVFGGKGLPEAGQTIGRGLRAFRSALNEAQDAMGRSENDTSPRSPPPRVEPRPKRLLD